MAYSAVEIANEHAREGRLFWLAGFARETWPHLQRHLDSLEPAARLAVEHYRDHLPSCAGDCGGCRKDSSQ